MKKYLPPARLLPLVAFGIATLCVTACKRGDTSANANMNEMLATMLVNESQYDKGREDMVNTSILANPSLLDQADVLRDFFEEFAPYPKFHENFKQRISQEFTPEEMAGIMEFMKSPAGLAFQEKIPRIQADLAQDMQDVILANHEILSMRMKHRSLELFERNSVFAEEE